MVLDLDWLSTLEKAHITERQAEVLSLIAAGFTAAEVAGQLNLSVHTVTRHITNMMQRSGAANSVELVARACFAGVLDLSSWPPQPSGLLSMGRSSHGISGISCKSAGAVPGSMIRLGNGARCE